MLLLLVVVVVLVLLLLFVDGLLSGSRCSDDPSGLGKHLVCDEITELCSVVHEELLALVDVTLSLEIAACVEAGSRRIRLVSTLLVNVDIHAVVVHLPASMGRGE